MEGFEGAFGEVVDTGSGWSFSLGPWIGGYLNSTDTWEWTGGEGIVTFADWMVNPEYVAPDNWNGLQNRMHFNKYSDDSGVNVIGWDDIEHDTGIVSFVVERSSPVPEPATMLLFGTGLAGLIGIRLRKKNTNNIRNITNLAA